MKLSTLKILTAISFLLVTVSNEKFSLFMGLFLLLLLFNSGLIEIIYAATSIFATIYLFASGVLRHNSNRTDLFTLIAIAILYIPICVALPSSLRHPDIWVYVTFILFGTISLTTFVWTIIRIARRKTTANKRFGKIRA